MAPLGPLWTLTSSSIPMLSRGRPSLQLLVSIPAPFTRGRSVALAGNLLIHRSRRRRWMVVFFGIMEQFKGSLPPRGWTPSFTFHARQVYYLLDPSGETALTMAQVWFWARGCLLPEARFTDLSTLGSYFYLLGYSSGPAPTNRGIPARPPFK